MYMLSPRQVHLDFHTSEKIPGIGSTFDPEAFARTVKEASVSSVTVFARGHHGWLYYPSKKHPELIHPNLEAKNLLFDQIRALHREGIRAPVYVTVQWDYQNAVKHPEWLIRKRDGSHEGGPFTEPGFYQSLCVNTGYKDFLKELTAEICEMLGSELDGFFFDIVGIRPCLCSVCRAEMKKRGIDAGDDAAVRDFAKLSVDRFKKEMTGLVRAYSKDCTVFYNAGHVGPCTKESADAYSHFELESLPSGSWGYLHFPVTARYARKLGKDAMGMTGKFHTEWGDFHSLKNLAALEFECFRMLSFGFASSIGDQLEPNGTLNPATYRLIGKVYGRFAEREAWGRPSVPVTEVCVVTSESPRYEAVIPESVMGAVQMLEELAIQFDVIDPGMELDGYKLVILPDDLTVTEEFRKKLDAYVEKGGKVIASAKGGMNGKGEYPDSFGARSEGPREIYPDFLVAEGELAKGLEPGNEYVIYMQGEALMPDGAETVLLARAPYFKREGENFTSHRYTPSAKGKPYPAVLRKDGVILFGHPLFGQYRQNAPFWCKKLISNAIDLLLGERIVRHDGPSTMTVSVLDQPEEGRTNLHILSYIPVRKSATIDVVEERTVLRNVTLKLRIPRKFTKARLVPEDVPLE
ncbi:MAG: beta-galactosidase trimerization domain-containing protein, partial [Clostridia bacterium]|nr:beta-galactosidase trimerization domain-containing protein [Clostridia bacterium]